MVIYDLQRDERKKSQTRTFGEGVGWLVEERGGHCQQWIANVLILTCLLYCSFTKT